MPALSRSDTSLIGRWWWTVDRWTLFAIAALIGFGYIMMLAASPAVAERIHQARDMFLFKQVAFLALAGAVVVSVSVLPPRAIRRLAIGVGLFMLVLTAMTLVAGAEIKGARRWVSLPGMSVQPSEFLKPCFAVVAAWLMTESRKFGRLGGMTAAVMVYCVIAVLLLKQPDVGMFAVVTTLFFAQLFARGLNMFLVAVGVGMFGGAGVAAYYLFSHVQDRVERFLHPDPQKAFQAIKSLEAFGNGGLLGRGPGEGHVKDALPDAHADFVFAVAGEEFGMIVCLLILGIFAFIVIRGLLRLLSEHDEFVILAATGLVTSFGLQAFINMSSALNLIPTKGMTLPFISYGGSSVVAIALQMGMLLALTRRRHHGDVA